MKNQNDLYSSSTMDEVMGEIKPGFKKTKLGWIPEEWEVNSLDKLVFIDKSTLSSKTEKDKIIKYVSLSDISNGEIGFCEYKFIDAPSRARRITVKGDVLLATVRPNLKNFAIVKHDDLIASTGFAVLTSKNANSNFIYYYLNSIISERQFHNLTVGSNYPALNSSDVKALKIVTPSLTEQKAIADCLGTWDEGITNLTQILAAKQELKKALMQQLITGKKRLPGFEEGWGEKRLAQIAKRVRRKNTEGDDTVVTISAQRGFVLQEDFFKKRVASDTLYNYTLVHKGEYCYNKSYSKGYPMGAFKRLEHFDKAVVTTLYICFGLKKNVDSDFMNQYFEAGRMIPGLMKIAQEGGRAHGLLNISLPDFFNLSVKVPSLKEQTAIAQVLNTADEEIELLTAQLEQMQLQKKGLMQQLLTGKKRLKGNG